MKVPTPSCAPSKGGGRMELSIQKRLKDLRVERGLTLEQLAEAEGSDF